MDKLNSITAYVAGRWNDLTTLVVETADKIPEEIPSDWTLPILAVGVLCLYLASR